MGPNDIKIEKVTPPKTKSKSRITPMSRPMTRSITLNNQRTQSPFEEEKKEQLHEDQGLLQER